MKCDDAARRAVDIDAREFERAFAVRSCAIRHSLCEHPSFDLDAIARLADRLPPDQVRRERGDLPLDDRGYVEVGVGSAAQTVRHIEHSNFRVSLREIQDDREYGPLIAGCHEDIAVRLGPREGGVHHASGYIFVSAGGSVTPMHFDGEHSFLLQIRGTKTVHTVPRAEPGEIQRELDRYFDGKECGFDAMRAAAERFELGPGDGVYLPSFVPHWVSTGSEPSISFSLPFYTRFSRRAEDVNRINTRLRKLGLAPRPPGASDAIDRAKAAFVRSVRAAKRPVQRFIA